jgi:hypothetical protein
MGGKSSGPEPIRKLLAFTREKMLARQGKRLRNIDVHDITCMIGECVVSGGVRRSALISLSDLDDNDIRDAKKGAFYNTEHSVCLPTTQPCICKNQQVLNLWMNGLPL